ncbi:hypothetical protein LJC56_02715 [Christensenellaceae bacterium OttesenSCG-928-K19]|nr:hypothetical protein [Christensenellaceae bacterium OttesenSCG-928-K19]
MAQSVATAYQDRVSRQAPAVTQKAVAAENVRAARQADSIGRLEGNTALAQIPKESLSKMTYYKPHTGGASLPRSMAQPVSRAAQPSAASLPSYGATTAQPANVVYGADGAKKEASMLPEMSRQNGTEAYSGCQTCQNRTYQDGSNDAGVSFQTAQHIPASMAGVKVASHEGEHVSRETEKAMQEERVVTQKKVTLQMGCCPECHKIYVAGGTTTISTMAAKNDTADAESALDLMGGAGEKVDMDI